MFVYKRKLRVLIIGDNKVIFNTIRSDYEVSFIPYLKSENIGSVLRANGYDCLIVDGIHVNAAQCAKWSTTVIPQHPSGRLIIRAGSNVNINLETARLYGICVANTPGVYNRVLELIVAHIKFGHGPVVVLGHGSIGKQVAKVALEKNAEVRVVDRSTGYTQKECVGVKYFTSLLDACNKAGCLTVQIPFNAQNANDKTKCIINFSVLNTLNHGARIISISPADIIDFEAFVKLATKKNLSLICCTSKNEIDNIQAVCATVASRIKLVDAAKLHTLEELQQRANIVAETLRKFDIGEEMKNIIILPMSKKDCIKCLRCSVPIPVKQSLFKYCTTLPKNIIVVGTGIASMTTMYYIKKSAKQPINIKVYEAAARCGTGASAHQGRHITTSEGFPFVYTAGGLAKRQFPKGFLTKNFDAYPQHTQQFIELYEQYCEIDKIKMRNTRIVQKYLGEKGMNAWNVLLTDGEAELVEAAKMQKGNAFRLYEDANELENNRYDFEDIGVLFKDVTISDVAERTGIKNIGTSDAVAACLEMDCMAFNTQAVCEAFEHILKNKYNVEFNYNARVSKININTDGHVTSIIVNEKNVTSDAFIFATGAETKLFADSSINLPVHAVVGTNVTVDVPCHIHMPTHIAKYFSSIGMVNISVVKKPNEQGHTLRLTGGFYIDNDASMHTYEMQIIHAMLCRFGQLLYPEIWTQAEAEGRIELSPPCFRPMSPDGLPIVGKLLGENTNMFYIGGTGKNGTSIAPVAAEIVTLYLSNLFQTNLEIATALSPLRFHELITYDS